MAQLITQSKPIVEATDWLEHQWGRVVARIFYIYDVPMGSSRGYHRHKWCQMCLLCLTGSVAIYVQTPDEDQHFWLDSPNQLLLLDPSDWRVMHHFSADAMLVAFADRCFDKTTYITTPYRQLINLSPFLIR